jgi:general secretion pathway protein G
MKFICLSLLVLLLVGCTPRQISKPAGSRMGEVQSEIRADFQVMEDALSRYFSDHGRYPDSLKTLTFPGAPDAVFDGKTPYLRAVPSDPWEREYRFQKPGSEGRAYEIWTLGADDTVGGAGMNRDWGNFQF